MDRAEIERRMAKIERVFDDPRLSTIDQIRLCGEHLLLGNLLTENQKPLSKDFSKVLYENLDDLYEV